MGITQIGTTYTLSFGYWGKIIKDSFTFLPQVVGIEEKIELGTSVGLGGVW